MSASDENQSDAKKTSADAAEALSGPTVENGPARSSARSPFKRQLKLFGALLLILVVGVFAATGAYPYWRLDAGKVLAWVGVDLEKLETSLNIPNWIITHGREAPKTTVTAPSVPPAPAKTETAQEISRVVPALVVSGSVAEPAPEGEEWRKASVELADRLSSVETRLSLIEGRLDSIDAARETANDASNAPLPTAAGTVPTDLIEQLDAIATRLAGVENQQKKLAAATDTAPAKPTESGALIGTVVGLAERVAAIETRGTTGALEISALRDDTLSLVSRVAGLDDEIKQVGVALKEDTPARDRATLLLLSVGQLAVTAASPRPYEAQLEAVRAIARDQDDLTGPLEQLMLHAVTGSPTLTALRTTFADASSAVIRSRDVGRSEGVLGETLSRVASLVTIRKVDDVGSGTVDGVLAAVDAALGSNDLAAAVSAAMALEGAPGEAIAPWLSIARARLAVDAALSDLQAAAIRALAAAG